MERMKPQVTISLNEYNELLGKEKELKNGDIDAYKHVIGALFKIGTADSIRAVLEDLKRQGYKMSMPYEQGTDKQLITVEKITL